MLMDRASRSAYSCSVSYWARTCPWRAQVPLSLRREPYSYQRLNFGLCVIAFAVDSVQAIEIPTFEGKGSAKNIFEFWKGYDARKEPLKIQLVESWKTEQGEVRLVLYSLGRLLWTSRDSLFLEKILVLGCRRSIYACHQFSGS